MKKLMLATVVTLASVSALASKARLNALQDARHVQDIQEVVQREPDQIVNYEAATVEFGGNSGATPEAEGGFIRKMGDSAWSLYLGRSSTTYNSFVNGITAEVGGDAGNALALGHAQGNPLQVTYGSKMGDISWGVAGFYAANDIKSAQEFDGGTTGGATESYSGTVDQQIGGVLVGANNGVWDAQLRVGLIGETETSITAIDASSTVLNALFNTGDKLEVNSKSGIRAGGGYRMDTMYYYGSYTVGSGEVKLNGAKLIDLKRQNVAEIGAINSLKKDGTDFFYGASVVMTDSEVEGTGALASASDKMTSTVVPLIVGVETEVNSWLTLRGALTQPLSFLSSEKHTGSSSGSVADATITTVGAGFKWGRATIDWVAGTGSTGEWAFDGATDPFTNVGLTYNF